MKRIDKGYMPAWTRMGRLQLLAFVVSLPLIALAAVWSYGPNIVRDHRYAGTYVVAPDLRATEGKCQRHAFLVTLCSAKVRQLASSAPPHTSNFIMLFRDADGAPMVPVRSTLDPSAVGIRYAVSDMLWTRTYSLFGSMALLLGCWWMFLNGLLHGRYRGGQAHAAALQYAVMKSSMAEARA